MRLDGKRVNLARICYGWQSLMSEHRRTKPDSLIDFRLHSLVAEVPE
jgi:hypothetical protein